MDCPYCQYGMTVKHGRRKIKRGTVQIFKCTSCGKFFSGRKLKNKAYDARTILTAVSLYNLAHTLHGAIKEMKKRHHQRIPESTLRSWVSGRPLREGPFVR